MGLLAGLWLALLGALAAPSLILAKRPEAKPLLDKIVPYQGWMGAISALWGVWVVISSILSLHWLSVAPVYWVTFLANGALLFCLGLLLGVGVLKTFIKQPAAVEKMDQMIARLAPKQGALGLAAIVLGLWMVIARFIFSVA